MNNMIDDLIQKQNEEIESLKNQLIKTFRTIDDLQNQLENAELELAHYKGFFTGETDPVKELNELISEMKEKRSEYNTLITELKLIRKTMK